MGGPISTAYMTAVPQTAAASVSPCLSRHDRTSPWPLTPPAGRFVDGSGPPLVSAPSPSRYVQPQLLQYLIPHHPGSTGHGSSRPSTAAGSNHQASSPNSSSVFYHVDRGRSSAPAGPSASPKYHNSAARWTDWRCGLRPSGAVSFRAVVDGDDARSSATEDHSSYQQHETTHEANGYHNSRLI